MDSVSDVGSCASQFSSVSFRGEMQSAEEAVDESIKDLQDGLNGCQSLLRQMLMADGRGDSYEEMEPMYNDICDLFKEFITLTKEMKGLAKQLLPPKPKVAKKEVGDVLKDCKSGI